MPFYGRDTRVPRRGIAALRMTPFPCHSGANTRPPPGAEKGSVFAEERGSGRKPVRATRRDLLDEWAERSAEESRPLAIRPTAGILACPGGVSLALRMTGMGEHARRSG